MLTKNQAKSFTNVRDQGNTVSDISERVLLRILLKTALAEILISESSRIRDIHIAVELSAQNFRDAWWGSEGEFDCAITLCDFFWKDKNQKLKL